MEPIKKFSFRKQILNVFIFTILITIFSRCEEDPIKAGFNLLGNDTLQIKVDTLSVELYTITSGPYMASAIGKSPLGSLNDPSFGQLKADFNADIMYTEDLVSFLDKEITDTITIYNMELRLQYTATYGDITDLDFDVYEMLTEVPDSTKSDYVVEANMKNPVPLNDSTPKKLNDSTNIFTVMLSNSYAEQFIDQGLIDDSLYYPKYYLEFKKRIKGLYIKAEYRNNSIGGGMILVDHLTSQLILRTFEKFNGKIDTIENVFVIGDPSIVAGTHVNMYNSILSSDITRVENDTININHEAFIQALAGPQILARIPGLKQKRTEYGYNRVINKAELVFPVNQEYLDDRFKPPYTIGIRDALTKKVIPDDGLVNGYLNGIYDSQRKQYTLNIGNQIHEFMQDTTEILYGDSFNIFAANQVYVSSGSTVLMTDYSLQSPGRVVFNNSDSDTPPFLRIVYSIIPE